MQTTQNKKKPAHNSFFYFMLDFKDKEALKGKHFDNLQQVSSAADSHWKQMSANQREPYEMKAREHKKQGKSSDDVKYTSQGISFSEMNRRSAKIREDEEAMKNDIRNILRRAYENGGNPY